MGKKVKLETRHRRIAKDMAATIAANSKGGRYYKATGRERLDTNPYTRKK